MYFGVELYESDVQYIEKIFLKIHKITTGIYYGVLIVNMEKYSPYLLDYIATFFEGFINTPSIPHNMNIILIFAVDRYRAYYSVITGKIEPYQHFFHRKMARKMSIKFILEKK